MVALPRLNAYFALARLSGHPLRQHYDQIAVYYELSSPQREANRLQRLQTLLRHATERVPLYGRRFRRAGIDVNRIRQLADLSHLPVLSKADTHNTADLISTTHRRMRMVESRTGGSTGVVTRLYRTESELDRFRAHALLAYRPITLSPTCRELAIIGADPSRRTGMTRLISQVLLSNHEINFAALDRSVLGRCVKTINRLKPEFIWGYTSLLTELARFVLAEGLTVHPPRVICNGAETLWPADRHLIASAFQAPVLNRYGSVDVGVIGVECTHATGLHLHDASTIVEIVSDGRPVPVGTPGQVLITHLDNYAMPLIRLDMGDLGTLTDTPCPCGRPGLRLTALEGRTDDLLVSSRGDLISGLRIGECLNRLPEITRFQVVQSTPHHVLFRLAASAECDRAAVAASALEIFGPGVSVDVEITEFFDMTPRYKFRRTIRKFPIKAQSHVPRS